MIDRYVSGRVDRVSPEAPIPILHVDAQRAMLGGVGNVGRNVAALGGHAVLVTVTGDDAAGSEIAEMATAEEHLTQRLIVERGRVSTVKTRYVADGHQLLRADCEMTAPISEETARRVIAAIRSELRRADVLVLSDYMKGVLTDDVLTTAIAEARVLGVPVIADPKRADFASYAGVSILKPNVAELAASARMPCDSEADIEAAARAVMQKCDIEAMMVSRSERGMTLLEREADALHLPARALEVFDVSGAGDTVVAATAVAIAAGAQLADAAELANIAGGIVVGKIGTAVVHREELVASWSAKGLASSSAKILPARAAVEVADGWRKRQQRIGFASGVFDLLHPGHLSLLSQGRNACDRLIVAIHSDDKASRIKGEGPPIQTETSRALVLASLAMVDMVVVFSDESPIALLDLLKPDLLIQGAGEDTDEIVGARVVRDYGGEVMLVPRLPGHSAVRGLGRLSAKPR